MYRPVWRNTGQASPRDGEQPHLEAVKPLLVAAGVHRDRDNHPLEELQHVGHPSWVSLVKLSLLWTKLERASTLTTSPTKPNHQLHPPDYKSQVFSKV